jgi:hypothetical protein
MKKIIPIVAMVIIISGCVSSPVSPFQKEFGGIKMDFRANLDEAANITVYPDEATLRSVLLNQNVSAIGIAYVANDTENSFYLADSFELAYKLTVINKYYFNRTKLIDSIPVNSSLDALRIASAQEPIIMLMGPPEANETLVGVVGNLVVVEGKSFEEVNKTYTDLDLATDKLLLVLMGS